MHSSSQSPDLPPALLEFRISHHQHPNSAFTSVETLPQILSSLSPPADLVISTAHGGDYALQTTYITACLTAKIAGFMPAEFGHDSLNPVVQDLLPPYAERARVIEFLKGKESAIEWVGLATGCDMSKRLVDGNIGIDLAWQSATVFGSGNEVFAASTSDFIGAAVVRVIEHWDELRNRYLCLSGLRTSYRRILDVLEREMQREFEVGYLDRGEGVKEARKRIEMGWPDAGMFLLERSVLADEGCFGGFVRDRDMLGKLGLEEEEELEKVVNAVVHQIQHRGKGGCGCG